ncbi:hypothetical protein [Mesorhizobium sp. M0040]|uniref:hypothetical protein n=1 Tax=Mesorhizobium sp. M0040 TaxID=2956855 RepID=UPI003338CD25
MQSLIASLITFGGLLSASPANTADTFIDAVVSANVSCLAPRNALVAYTIDASAPPAVAFLIGPGGQVSHQSLEIEPSPRAGASIATSISATLGGVSLSSGFSNNSVMLRLVTNERSFCQTRPNIVLTYTLADKTGTKFPDLRLSVVADSGFTVAQLTPSGTNMVIASIDEKFGPHIKLFASDSFAWLDQHLAHLAKTDTSNALQDYCICADEMNRQQFVLALARFLDHIDPMLIMPASSSTPLSEWRGRLSFTGRSVLNSSGLQEEAPSLRLEFSKSDSLDLWEPPYSAVTALKVTEIVMDGKSVPLH